MDGPAHAQDPGLFQQNHRTVGQGDLPVTRPKLNGGITPDIDGYGGLCDVLELTSPNHPSADESFENWGQLADSLASVLGTTNTEATKHPVHVLKKLSFYDLPSSVRERVYRDILVLGRVYINCYVTTEVRDDVGLLEEYEPPDLALLATSKQINAEAADIFYRENIFALFHADYLAAQLELHPEQKASFLRVKRLEISFDYRDYAFFTVRVPVMLAIMAKKLSKDCHEQESILNYINTMRTKLQGTDIMEGEISNIDGKSGLELITRDNIGAFVHARHSANMEMYIWGRVMDVLRRYTKLDVLSIDVRRCQCPQKCCRFANRVTNFGVLEHWLHAAPKRFECRGAGKKEIRVMAKSLATQKALTGAYQQNSPVTHLTKLPERFHKARTNNPEAYAYMQALIGNKDILTVLKDLQTTEGYDPFCDFTAPVMHTYICIAKLMPSQYLDKPTVDEVTAVISAESEAALHMLRARERRKRRAERQVCPDGHVGCAFRYGSRHSKK